jgi:hypothetical protein
LIALCISTSSVLPRNGILKLVFLLKSYISTSFMTTVPDIVLGSKNLPFVMTRSGWANAVACPTAATKSSDPKSGGRQKEKKKA